MKCFPIWQDLVNKRDLGTRKMFAPYEYNVFNSAPISKKTVPYEQNKII